MTALCKESSFAWLEATLRLKLSGVKSYTTTLQITEEFAQEHPEQDLNAYINIWKGWLAAAIAEVAPVKSVLQEKRTDAALALVMGQHARLGSTSGLRKLPMDIIAMILSDLYFY